MILFQEDWLHYPTAIVDYKTKNQSFLDYANLLKEMGVKNHLFCLSLLQPELQGVDPYDYEWLEAHPEYMRKIWFECRYNPWYYLREVCRLKSNAGVNHNPIRANRGIICEFWVRLNNIDLFIMQPRQTGKSVGADALTNWYMLFAASNTTLMLLTKDNDLRGKNVARLKAMREILPKYLVQLGPKDKDNQTDYNYSQLENDLISKAAQKDEEGAMNLGRGLTIALFQNDEQPFMKFLHLFYPVALASMNAARQEAEEKGEPHGVLVTTTAGDLTTPEGKYSFNYYNGGCPWTEHLFDETNHANLIETIKRRRSGKNIMISACFNHRMLGISDEKFYELINAAPSDPANIDRDYFLIWTTNSEAPVLDKLILESIQKSERDPDYVEITPIGNVINWFFPQWEKGLSDEEKLIRIKRYMRENQCVIGSDTSEMIGRDSTTFYIQDIKTMATVATLRIGDNNVTEVCQWFANFMLEYENLTLVMERKSTAVLFLDTMIPILIAKGINPFKRIYNQVIQDPDKHRYIYDQLRHGRNLSYDDVHSCRKLFGFMQTGSTRNFLYGTLLKNLAKQNQHVIYDRTLSGELRGLRIDQKSGRVDHGVDGHDDMVIAWLLSGWFLLHGKNLDFYGIDKRRIMMNVSAEGKQFDEMDIIDNQYVDELNDQMDLIQKQIRSTTHPLLLNRLQQRLMHLNDELEDYGYTPRNIDEIIKEARVARHRALYN